MKCNRCEKDDHEARTCKARFAKAFPGRCAIKATIRFPLTSIEVELPVSPEYASELALTLLKMAGSGSETPPAAVPPERA